MITATVRIGRADGAPTGADDDRGERPFCQSGFTTMTDITHRFVQTNGLRMHVAQAGDPRAPAVVLCHGFPESWYSWRHQLVALAEAGYHAIAPDQRGYGQTDAPPEIGAYTQLHLVGDLVGMLSSLDHDQAVIVGHDWGGPVAWNAALVRPDLFRAVVGVSIHWSGQRGSVRPTDGMRAAMGDAFLYILHFQEEGRAERELDADIRRSMRQILYSLSADNPGNRARFFNPRATTIWDCLREPDRLPDWLTPHDLDVFVAEFERKGTFRHGINWYRCIDASWELLAPFDGRKIEQPALFVGAEHDVILGQTPEAVLATRAMVPNLRDPVWIPDCGHWIQQEEPARFNEALLSFLGSLP
jgi:pimeloyl-ACP methyl ester carboxylesterase